MTAFAAMLLASALLTGAQIVPADDAIHRLLGVWDGRQLVAVAEVHRLVQDKEFLISLIGTPEFPNKVNDVVIEFGNARFQPTLDRYMAGKSVPPGELRRVWADTTVVNGLWDAPVYKRFLASVREHNQRLPKRHKLRVLACDPPIDWTKVRTIADARPYLERDGFCASVIEREVLAKHHKALVIMGDAHVIRRHMTGEPLVNAVTLVERKHPGTVFVAVTYFGQYKDSALIEQRLAAGPTPSLSLLQGTGLGALLAVPPRPPTRTRVGGGQSTTEEVVVTTPPRLEEVADALLYLGPKASLTRSTPREEDFGPDELRELDRRNQLLFGLPLDRQTLLQ
jgi:hypothetical protein